jgi:hypothetical protein
LVVVLWEMLTGAQLFAWSATVSDTIGGGAEDRPRLGRFAARHASSDSSPPAALSGERPQTIGSPTPRAVRLEIA